MDTAEVDLFNQRRKESPCANNSYASRQSARAARWFKPSRAGLLKWPEPWLAAQCRICAIWISAFAKAASGKGCHAGPDPASMWARQCGSRIKSGMTTQLTTGWLRACPKDRG
jgi:hypothetical protein